MFDWFRTLNDSIVTFSRTFIAIFLGDLTDSVKSVKLTEALVTGIESSMEKSARWTNLLQETTQSAWWYIRNGQNTFLGRPFVLWESFQWGSMSIHEVSKKMIRSYEVFMRFHDVSMKSFLPCPNVAPSVSDEPRYRAAIAAKKHSPLQILHYNSLTAFENLMQIHSTFGWSWPANKQKIY